MEPRFGHDFSRVRVHSDAAAASSALALGARAYTSGLDIVLGAGINPSGAASRALIAHELAHVVQQSRGVVDGRPTAGGFRLSHPSDRFEQEAEATSARVLRAGPGRPLRPLPGGTAGVAQRAIQRAILVVDGPADTADAKAITTTCLNHLGTKTTRKGVVTGLGGAAPRGRSIRTPSSAVPAVPPGFLGEDEPLYVLGHGEPTGTTVGGLTAAQFADYLHDTFGHLFASGTRDFYLGRIKFVACISAKDAAKGAGVNFAASLASALKTSRKYSNHFLPISVDGIVGVGWVDGNTGKLQSIDLAAYLAVYNRPGGPKELTDTFKSGDPAGLTSLLGGAITEGKYPGDPAPRAGKERHKTY